MAGLWRAGASQVAGAGSGRKDEMREESQWEDGRWGGENRGLEVAVAQGSRKKRFTARSCRSFVRRRGRKEEEAPPRSYYLWKLGNCIHTGDTHPPVAPVGSILQMATSFPCKMMLFHSPSRVMLVCGVSSDRSPPPCIEAAYCRAAVAPLPPSTPSTGSLLCRRTSAATATCQHAGRACPSCSPAPNAAV
jgi:hypothetical protein